MRTIDLKDIIKKRGLDIKEIAKQLFPFNHYPRLALNRVISGKSVLDADQISKLASLAGTSISELYLGFEWKAVSKGRFHTFTNDNFKAELDSETGVTKIFDNKSLFHESVIHSPAIPLSEYLIELNSIINKYKEL